LTSSDKSPAAPSIALLLGPNYLLFRVENGVADRATSSADRRPEVSMRFLLRLASLIALAVAVIAGTIDSIQSVAASAVVITPMGDAWQDLSPSSLSALQSSISYYVNPRFYALLFQWLMLQPAFAVFLVLSLLFWMVGYKKPPMAGRFAA
jgi:hypothetical protein